MAPILDDLLSDDRLARLFSKDAGDCALQLWVLQIKSDQVIEHRVVYGRLVQYSHSSGRWSFSDRAAFDTFGDIKARLTRLNLYVKSAHCADLLRRFSTGQTLSTISEALGLGRPETFDAQYGAAALAADGLAFRPVAYLLNGDAHERRSPSSPHAGAGAFSASISQTRKAALFRLGPNYDVALTASVVRHLNEETGLDFGGIDAVRFGDLELLVFPTLDDFERALLSVSWTEAPLAFLARFDPKQVPSFSAFQFRLTITNDGQIVYSCIATAQRSADRVFECRFQLSSPLHAMSDCAELEIFGFPGDPSSEGTLCCRWRNGYVRELHLQMRLDRGASPVKFDWLEKTTRDPASGRVQAALTIRRGTLGSTDRIGGREADPWVPANRDLASVFSRLHPPKSEGRFFLRWGASDGEGRLQFVEWFKELLAKHRQRQMVIFDPYFEASGLGLLLLSAAENTNYIVFTSMPKSVGEDSPRRRKRDNAGQERMNNLLANCKRSQPLMKRIHLRIVGLKEGRLHDRYILIMASDGLPIAGFNLSNSFQMAAENFPLLVTPIPADTLLAVEHYASDLVREADAAQSDGDTENSVMRLIFDSKTVATAPQSYEPLHFLEEPLAGEVLSVWSGEPSLRALSGAQLKERVAALNLFQRDAFVLPEATGLLSCLNRQANDFADFTATWKVLGAVLAHAHVGDCRFPELHAQRGFLEFLARFLEQSFSRVQEEEEVRKLAMMDVRLLRDPLETLLHSPRRLGHLVHPTKYTPLTWPEFFAIRFLWWYAPDVFLGMAESQLADLSIAPEGPSVVRLGLLSQLLSEIALSAQFALDPMQRDGLLRSRNGLLKWIGLNAIELQLEKPDGLATVLPVVAILTDEEGVQALGWMVHHAAGDSRKADVYNGLVTALHAALPATLPRKDLGRLVDAMRGHMKTLPWVEPWLFKDVVSPLLRDGRASTDDACEIWVQELVALLGPEDKGHSRLFDRAREGQTTNIAAYLFASSSPERQQDSLKAIRANLKRQQRIVQQPLASTSDWRRWHDALLISMWILIFTQCGLYYLRENGMTCPELENLSREARALAMVMPMSEWRSDRTVNEFAAFFDQLELLLASSGEPEGTPH